MITIQFEEMQLMTTCFVYSALMPFLLVPFFRKNPQKILLENLKQEFGIQKISSHEFFGTPYQKIKKYPHNFYFKFQEEVRLSEIQTFIEELLKERGYTVYFSLLTGDDVYQARVEKRKSRFHIQIISGIYIEQSFRFSITQTRSFE